MKIFILFTVGFAFAWPPTVAAADRSALPEAVRTCAICHNKDGVSKYPNIPSLAGQKIEYLLKQTTLMADSARLRLGEISDQEPPTTSSPSGRLTAHRENRDADRQMAALDEGRILDISVFFASKPRACAQPAANRSAPPVLVAHCAACHGQDGVSSDPNVPHLAGQQRFYLLEQFRLFRATGQELDPTFTQRKRYCPFMSSQTALISKEQMTALATWFATAPCDLKK